MAYALFARFASKRLYTLNSLADCPRSKSQTLQIISFSASCLIFVARLSTVALVAMTSSRFWYRNVMFSVIPKIPSGGRCVRVRNELLLATLSLDEEKVAWPQVNGLDTTGKSVGVPEGLERNSGFLRGLWILCRRLE